MDTLYPLLMQPGFDPRPWGTQDLSPIYPNHRFEQKIGEAWLTGDECKISNGPLRGQTLAHISEQYQSELVGEAARDPKRFPLLLKFLFPYEKLSVQVHPDDAQALARLIERYSQADPVLQPIDYDAARQAHARALIDMAREAARDFENRRLPRVVAR